MRKIYPGDISRAKFEAIQPVLDSARNTGCLRRVDLYEVCCAVLYRLQSGRQWRMLPEALPNVGTVHSYWQRWREPGQRSSLLEQALKKSGRRGPKDTEAQRVQQTIDRGWAERQK